MHAPADPLEATGNLAWLCERGCRAHPERLFLALWLAGTGWWWVAYGEFFTLVEAFRGGLAGLGIGPGDRVAVVSSNRLEWAVACYAIAGRGAVLVPIEAASPAADVRRALAGSGAQAVICGGDTATAALLRRQEELPALEHVIGLDLPATERESYRALLDAGRRRPVAPVPVDPSAAAALAYPSPPAAGPASVLTHAAAIGDAAALRERLGLVADDRALALLPWTSRAGQIGLHAVLGAGGLLAIDPGLDRLQATAAAVGPTVVFAGDELLVDWSARLEQQLATRPRPLRRLLRRGLAAAARRRRGEPLHWIDERLAALAERLLPAQVRAPLEAGIRCAISAGRPLGADMLNLADAFGVRVLEFGKPETGD